jgi:hypothetical protein
MMVTVNQKNILHRCGLEHAAQGKRLTLIRTPTRSMDV